MLPTPKTIFISIYDGDTERVILRTKVFATLRESGNRIVLLIRGKDRVAYYEREYGSDQVLVEELPSATSRREAWWFSVGWNTIPTRATAVRRYRDYFLKQKYGMYLLGGLLSFLGRSRIWRRFLRSVYYHYEGSYARELFERYHPDLVFAVNFFSPEDAQLLVAARKRSIPTVTLAKSWDVLTTKAFTRVHADRLLVFNETNQEEAVRLGDYRPEAVVVTGFPQFDAYTNPDLFLSREEFCRPLGLDPARRIILYGIPGDWKSPDTRAVLTGLSQATESGAFQKPIQILARFHPKYHDSSEGLHLPHVVFDRPGVYFSQSGEFSLDAGNRGQTTQWTFRDDDIVHLANSLYHADVVVNVDSTLTLDATALGKPAILVGFDGDRHLPYKQSIAFIYEREHYQNVLMTGGVVLTHSLQELVEEIKSVIADPHAYRSSERAELGRRLLYTTDGHAGARMGKAVLELLP